ncbi:MAG: hypothetical protein JXN63_02670 [Candidatus Delongbacteria bacterium]|nr:hypothetical protein [Candidatus Delongbacteria bacterium]
MKKFYFIILLSACYAFASNEFLLFDEKNITDQSVFFDHKFNRMKMSHSIFPSGEKKFNLGYSRFFTKKTGVFFNSYASESGVTFYEKSEFALGLTYRFTKRSRTWVFLGDIGFSLNDDVKDDLGRSKGYRINHAVGRFIAEYTFKNGFGFDYSMSARMPIEFDLDESMSPIHSVGIVFQF